MFKILPTLKSNLLNGIWVLQAFNKNNLLKLLCCRFYFLKALRKISDIFIKNKNKKRKKRSRSGKNIVHSLLLSCWYYKKASLQLLRQQRKFKPNWGVFVICLERAIERNIILRVELFEALEQKTKHVRRRREEEKLCFSNY